MNPTISFTHSYPKLNYAVFTTIRPYTPQKLFYYRVQRGRVFDVIVRGSHEFTACLLEVLVVDMSKLSKSFINYDAAGLWKLPTDGMMLLLMFKRENTL